MAQLVEELSYNPQGRGFDSRVVFEIFHGLGPSCPTVTLGSTQPVTEMSTRDLRWE